MFSLYENNCDLFAPMDQKEQLINGSVSLTKSNYSISKLVQKVITSKDNNKLLK